jgi:uncharacterized membrane protein YfcA
MSSLRANREPLLLGLGAGVVSGLFGVGGGVVMVPGMVLWLGLGAHRAHATSVAAIVAAAAAGLAPFAVAGDVEWAAAPALFAGGALGAYAGARLLGSVPAVWLTRAFVVLLLVTAGRLALE